MNRINVWFYLDIESGRGHPDPRHGLDNGGGGMPAAFLAAAAAAGANNRLPAAFLSGGASTPSSSATRPPHDAGTPLARFFSPDVLAAAQGGACPPMPPLPIRQALTLEEIERQAAAAAVRI
jgi:hypothetical protein